ncbi:MAG: hypothetical protein WBP85_16800, partial [Terracidiphilus sp.]
DWGTPWRRRKAANVSLEDLLKNGNPVEAALYQLRETHPTLLIEYERQTVMSMLRGATGAAMVMGAAIFCGLPKLLPSAFSVWVLATVGGSFLLLVFWFSALPHMRVLTLSTLLAGKTAKGEESPQPPDEPPHLEVIVEELAEAQDEPEDL